MKKKRKSVPAVKGLGPQIMGTGPVVRNQWDMREVRSSLDRRIYRNKFGSSYCVYRPHALDYRLHTHGGVRKKWRERGKFNNRERARRESIRNGGFVEVKVRGHAVSVAYENFLRGRIQADERNLFGNAKMAGHTPKSVADIFMHSNACVRFRIKNDAEARMWFKLAVG